MCSQMRATADALGAKSYAALHDPNQRHDPDQRLLFSEVARMSNKA